MRTIEQIKAEILALNPSRKYIINDEEFEQTDAEFNEAVEKRAQMEFEQEQFVEELKQQRLVKISGYQKIGLTNEEIIAVLGLTETDDLKALGL